MVAGGPAGIVEKLTILGETDRMNPFAFTGWWTGEFPAAWFVTMMVIAILGGFGMGTSNRLVPRGATHPVGAYRTRRQLQYLVGHAGRAGAQFGLGRGHSRIFVLFSGHDGNVGVRDGVVPAGLRLPAGGYGGLLFRRHPRIHLSTISSHLNLGALYATPRSVPALLESRGVRTYVGVGGPLVHADSASRLVRVRADDGEHYGVAHFRALDHDRRDLAAEHPPGGMVAIQCMGIFVGLDRHTWASVGWWCGFCPSSE